MKGNLIESETSAWDVLDSHVIHFYLIGGLSYGVDPGNFTYFGFNGPRSSKLSYLLRVFTLDQIYRYTGERNVSPVDQPS